MIAQSDYLQMVEQSISKQVLQSELQATILPRRLPHLIPKINKYIQNKKMYEHNKFKCLINKSPNTNKNLFK